MVQVYKSAYVCMDNIIESMKIFQRFRVVEMSVIAKMRNVMNYIMMKIPKNARHIKIVNYMLQQMLQLEQTDTAIKIYQIRKVFVLQ